MTREHALSRRAAAITLSVLAIFATGIASHGSTFAAETWRGLTVTPQDRCSPCDRADYRYPQSVEAKIVAGMGGRIYGPHTGRTFRSTGETDIDLCAVQHNSIDVAETIMLC